MVVHHGEEDGGAHGVPYVVHTRCPGHAPDVTQHGGYVESCYFVHAKIDSCIRKEACFRQNRW